MVVVVPPETDESLKPPGERIYSPALLGPEILGSVRVTVKTGADWVPTGVMVTVPGFEPALKVKELAVVLPERLKVPTPCVDSKNTMPLKVE